MKTIRWFCVWGWIVCLGCTTYREQQKITKANEAYLLFVNQAGKYPDGVEVYIDDAPAFIAMVAKADAHSKRADRWPVKMGRIQLKVVYEGAVVYNQTVTLKKQQTKEIELP